MNKKSVFLVVGLFIFAVIVLIFSIFFSNNGEKEKEKIQVLRNPSEFYTVDSCIYRTLTYLNTKDVDSMLLLIPNKYKKDNKVTKDNVLSFFYNIDVESTFSSKKMYYEKVNSYIKKYYVYGLIEEFVMLSDDDLSQGNGYDAYFIVYLDSENNTFMIEPYDGEIFKGESK